MRGRAHIDAHAAREEGRLILSGTVVDDAARPVLGARVSVGIARAMEPRESIALVMSAPRSCGGSGPGPEVYHADLLLLSTDEAARFCVSLALATDKYVARIESRNSELVDGAKLDLPLDLALPSVTIRFDPERSVVSLDEDMTSLDAIASTEGEGVTAFAAGLVLSLSNEAGVRLATATTDSSGRATFTVEGARLGPPGQGELRAIFAGSASAGPSSRAMPVERRTHVDLASPDANARRLPIGCPDDGIIVRLIATPRCRGCAGSPSGAIEARVGTHVIVGAAPIVQGEARLLIAFAASNADAFPNPSAAELPLTFRFVANASWFQPAGELVLIQPMRGPSPWKSVPLVVAAGVVIAWLFLARYPVRRRIRRGAAHQSPPAHVGERVHLLRTALASQGWTGQVTDAQDGIAIAHARVAIERRGFGQVDVVSETTSDAIGRFALPPIDARPGDDLVAEGPLHAALRHGLPSSGELIVSLVLRKRALLDRLVAWARHQGGPFVGPRDPTPGDVRRAAGSDATVTHWVDAIEKAAYGGAAVDARVQADVDRLAPP